MKKDTVQSGKGPVKDPSYTVSEESELMKFLFGQMPHKNRDNIKSLLRDKQVLVDGEPVSQYNHPLHPGQVVTITRNKIGPARTYHGISIVYEDNYLVVIDKHSGILSVATDDKEKHTAYSLLYDHVKKNNPDGMIFIVHRLDRETSGLMVFAKSAKVQKLMQKSWNDIILERTYIALAEGDVVPPEGEISSYLRESKNMVVYSSQVPGSGQWAVTKYETLRSARGFTLLKMSLRTGRKNQIRVHLRDIGFPVTGDKKYGAVHNPIGRMGLHAQVLAFRHPVTLKEMRFETVIPRKFFAVFK